MNHISNNNCKSTFVAFYLEFKDTSNAELCQHFNNVHESSLREHSGLNEGPLDLQLNALPLSYAPSVDCNQNVTGNNLQKVNI